MDGHELSSQHPYMNQTKGNRKMSAIQSIPLPIPFPLMQCPELSKMGLIFPEYLSGLKNTITQCETDRLRINNRASVNDIVMDSLNKSNLSQSTQEADILNIREPICPGN